MDGESYAALRPTEHTLVPPNMHGCICPTLLSADVCARAAVIAGMLFVSVRICWLAVCLDWLLMTSFHPQQTTLWVAGDNNENPNLIRYCV